MTLDLSPAPIVVARLPRRSPAFAPLSSDPRIRPQGNLHSLDDQLSGLDEGSGSTARAEMNRVRLFWNGRISGMAKY